MGTENTQPTAAPAVDYAAIAKGAQEASKEPLPPPQHIPELEGTGADKPTAEPPEPGEEKPVEQKTEPKPKSDLEVNFEKLVRQSQENRKMMEAAKPGIELANALGTPNAQALQKAIVSRDPLSALAAIGFSYKDVADAVIGRGGTEKKPSAKPDAQPKPAEPAQSTLPPEVQEVIREHQQMKAERQRQAVDAEIKKVISSDAGKFTLVSKLDATHEVASVLEEMFARGGFPQGATPQEIIRIAAEEAESRLARQRERWAKVLTTGTEPASVPGKATETPAQPAQDGGRKTLTNALAAPAASVSPPSGFDVEAIYEKLKNDPNMRK